MRKFGPKKEDGEVCKACNKVMKMGDYTTLIFLGPGDDPEEQKLAQQGKVYTAVAIEIHYACAGGKID